MTTSHPVTGSAASIFSVRPVRRAVALYCRGLRAASVRKRSRHCALPGDSVAETDGFLAVAAAQSTAERRARGRAGLPRGGARASGGAS